MTLSFSVEFSNGSDSHSGELMDREEKKKKNKVIWLFAVRSAIYWRGNSLGRERIDIDKCGGSVVNIVGGVMPS